ncbi:MAG TPA: hypothetical protein PKD55_26195 [Bellilinea sp.]|nr:hypothetical protein [Bellilinea sp.]
MEEYRKLEKLREAVASIDMEEVMRRWQAQQDERDKACAEGDHGMGLRFFAFSGSDILWCCNNCNRIVTQVGGNLPMTI